MAGTSRAFLSACAGPRRRSWRGGAPRPRGRWRAGAAGGARHSPTARGFGARRRCRRSTFAPVAAPGASVTGPVLVLGSGGFIGRALVAQLAANGTQVIATTRDATAPAAGIATRQTGRLSAATDWPALLADARTIVHLASRAHAPAERGDGWIAAEATTGAALARAAAAEGIERIVLMSSIKAHGEDSGAGRFRASDKLAPADAYGRAKAAIEAAMMAESCPLVVL